MKKQFVNLAAVMLFAAGSVWAADAQKEAFILPGDILIPQVATGGDGTYGLFMTFEFVNMTNGPATVQVTFSDSSGNPMVLSFEQDGAPVQATFLSKAFGAKGSSFARTFPTGPTQVGYARVTSIPENAVAVSATFNQAVEGRPLFQSFIPLSSGIQNRFLVPMLNAGASTGSIAIVSLAAQDVTLSVLDANGVTQCSTTRTFAAGEHTAFVAKDMPGLACTANVNTVLEVQGTQAALGAVGITAQDSGAFSTQPVYGLVPLP